MLYRGQSVAGIIFGRGIFLDVTLSAWADRKHWLIQLANREGGVAVEAILVFVVRDGCVQKSQGRLSLEWVRNSINALELVTAL